MASQPVIQYYRVIQYNGSNLSDIQAMLFHCTGFSQSGGVLSFTDQNSVPQTVNTNDWVREGAIKGNYNTSYPPSQFVAENILVSDAADLSTLETRVDDVETALGGSTPALAIGIAVAPTLLLSASATVPVNLIPAMPSGTYTVSTQLIAPSSALGSLSITGTSIVDADTVNVTVQNSGLVNLSGVNIMVVAKS